MASMVAKACGSTSSQMPDVTVQEKGSRNKRKFMADPSVADPSKIIPLPSNEFSCFEFSAQKFNSNGHTSACDMCPVNQDPSSVLKLELGLSCAVGTSEAGVSQRVEKIEASANEFDDAADWSDLTESELEELVLKNLDTIFNSAIKKIIASGYGEEVATKAILRSGLWQGCRDTVSNIVDRTLAFLQSGRGMNPSRDYCFEDLQQMEKYILAELVCLLREVRPFFSTGDAMWRLLICDMNVLHACAMEDDPMGSFLGDTNSDANSSISAQPQLRTELKSSDSNAIIPCKPNVPVAYAQNCPSDLPIRASVHRGNTFQYEAPKISKGTDVKPKTSFVPNKLVPNVDCQISTFNINEKPFSTTGMTHTLMFEEKYVASGKLSGIAKREYILHQKSMHLEKFRNSHGSKATSRVGKFSSFGGLVLDKKLKGIAGSAGLTAKNAPLKISKENEIDIPTDSISTNTGFNSSSIFGLETIDHDPSVELCISSDLPLVPVNAPPSLPVADTELALTFPAKSIANPMPISYNMEAASCSYIDSLNNNSVRQWASQDAKDEMIMKFVPRARELQNQLQEWTEWANQKVMQAARKLSKDKSELKTLRQDKEEVERLKKEKQILEENTMKKLLEMENALCKARRQVELTNADLRRLEVENVVLRQEMGTAKLHAAESATRCQEVLKREKKTMMKFQSWEKQKAVFQEELSAEKLKLMQMQAKLQQAKDVLNQVEDKLNQEKRRKEELLSQKSSLRKEREQIEFSTRSKEDMIRLRAEGNLQKYKKDITRLEKEISKLRLKTDSYKIAALRRGIDGSYASKVTDLRYTPSPTKSAISCISKLMTTADIQEFTGNGAVKRERECVMCLSEEMSVVFLPCAHQVVCTICNELHEKQGMKDCPSCRSLIQKRVNVCYAAPC